EHQVRERDRINEVLLFTSVERAVAEEVVVGSGRVALPEFSRNVLVRLREETARAAARIVNRLARLGVDDLDHGADDLARGEKLPAVVALLAHLEQQPLVNLREREDVR